MPHVNDGSRGAPNDPGMTPVVQRNIRTLKSVRDRASAARSRSDRFADAVTGFAGSMAFVFVHAAILTAWLGWNTIAPARLRYDPYPFVMLAMAASVEAIFLSTFILISQNRAQHLADQRAELDLQIGLLTEHELTRAVQLIDAMAHRMGVSVPGVSDLDDVERDVNPERVAAEIAAAAERPSGH